MLCISLDFYTLFAMTSWQPTQAQCLYVVSEVYTRVPCTVTTSSMLAIKLLGSYLIATYKAHTYATDAMLLDHIASFLVHVGEGKWPGDGD